MQVDEQKGMTDLNKIVMSDYMQSISYSQEREEGKSWPKKKAECKENVALISCSRQILENPVS